MEKQFVCKFVFWVNLRQTHFLPFFVGMPIFFFQFLPLPKKVREFFVDRLYTCESSAQFSVTFGRSPVRL